MELFSLKSDLL